MSRSRTPTRSTVTEPEAINETKSGNADKVRILVRIRPLHSNEEWNENLKIKDVTQEIPFNSQEQTIKIIKPDSDSVSMRFDGIFPPDLDQNFVFDELQDSVDRFLSGENQTFFAYGQTGAGKTYTMMGNLPENDDTSYEDLLTNESRGILPRALEKILSFTSQENRNFKLWASFLEIYNEKIFDLLTLENYHKSSGLELRETASGGNLLVDLLQVEIKTIENALDCLKLGLLNRMTGSTHANTKSSRSHCIFQLTFTQPDPKHKGKEITSKLKIVDLAGSEKFKIAKNITSEEKELRIHELTSINGSLSTLGHCISALTDSKRTHIPFRNSKLTRVLRDSLTGQSRISFVFCISPSTESTNESISTLQFASRAKKIILDNRTLRKNKSAKPNGLMKGLNPSDFVDMFKEIMQRGFSKDASSDDMHSKISFLEKELLELKAENKELKQEVMVLKRSYSPDIAARRSASIETYNRTTDSRKASDFESPNKSEKSQRSALSNENPNYKNSSPAMKNQTDKRSRPGDDILSDKLKHEQVYNDNSIFENLSIFKDIQMKKNSSKVGKENFDQRRNPERESPFNFWTNVSEDDEYANEKVKALNQLMANRQNNDNLLAQKIKQKEVERRYELFFGQDSKPSFKKEPTLAEISQATINVERKDSTKNKFIPMVSNSKATFGIDERALNSYNDGYFTNKGLNNETFHNMSSNSRLFYEQRVLGDSLSLNENYSIQLLNPEPSLNSELSSFVPLRNRQLDSSSDNHNYLGSRSFTDSQDFSGLKKVPTGKKLLFNDENFNSSKKQDTIHTEEQSSILEEFDRKLSSVQQLNRKHQELIKNLDKRLADFQSTPSPRGKNETPKPALVPRENFSNQENIVHDSVSGLKRQLSDAFQQYENIQKSGILDSRINESRDALRSIRHDSNQDLSNVSIKGNRRSSSKSSKDILMQQWNSFKENFKV